MKMKFSALFLLALASSGYAHSTMSSPPTRGHPLNPNAAVHDFDCIAAPLNGGAGCAPKSFPCGGYPPDKQVVTVLKAGSVVPITFFNQNIPNPQTANPNVDQARHNGGFCEFALSYDGGVTYTVIATYHKTCPDVFFNNWVVKIPNNAPSCNTAGKCLFTWSWINAVGNREFYMNCADVKIEGNATNPLPIKDITRANLPPMFPNIITPPGDPANTGNEKGSGPLQSDINNNLAMNIDTSIDGTGNTAPANNAPSTNIVNSSDDINNPVESPITSTSTDNLKNDSVESSTTSTCTSTATSAGKSNDNLKNDSVESTTTSTCTSTATSGGKSNDNLKNDSAGSTTTSTCTHTATSADKSKDNLKNNSVKSSDTRHSDKKHKKHHKKHKKHCSHDHKVHKRFNRQHVYRD